MSAMADCIRVVIRGVLLLDASEHHALYVILLNERIYEDDGKDREDHGTGFDVEGYGYGIRIVGTLASDDGLKIVSNGPLILILKIKESVEPVVPVHNRVEKCHCSHDGLGQRKCDPPEDTELTKAIYLTCFLEILGDALEERLHEEYVVSTDHHGKDEAAHSILDTDPVYQDVVCDKSAAEVHGEYDKRSKHSVELQFRLGHGICQHSREEKR